MKLFRKEEGFTLVELMVVVLIIGILVAIAIPVFNAARGNAQERSCQANLRTLDGAIEQWRAADASNDPGTWTLATAQTALSPYVKTFPECPAQSGAAAAYAIDVNATAHTAAFTCEITGHDYD